MALELTVPSMACSVCADKITKAVQKVDPNAQVQADPKSKIVSIQTQHAETEIKHAIVQAGYPVA
ncbi:MULTISPECIES: heavy-metal-associated domain-containing protein [Aerosakkonema]|uniref:heavy-metal-associated domain-containing protein n=1 Tax=Aerosakkonema TaxID=1246629 RepID=UPI0035B8A30D